MNKIKQLLKNFISIFYPRSCVACGNALMQNESHFCLSCLMHLPETNYHLMEHSPLDYIFEGRVSVEKVASMLFYKKGNKVQHILHALKYKGNKEVGRFLGELYGRQLLKSPYYQSVDCIVPIPLHPKKLRMRGYNQSELLANHFANGVGLPVCLTALVRSRDTQSQTKLGRAARLTNMSGAFTCLSPGQVKGKVILLIDDVATTGATLEGCAAALRAAGAKRVLAYTYAREN